MNVDELRFDAQGLIPAVVQDDDGGAVLMLGYMDREALAATQATGDVHFHSRSRGRLWRKGETSGNGLRVVAIGADCDGDALLVRARPLGPTCHTGSRSCFGDAAEGPGLSLGTLFSTIRRRMEDRPKGSYTVRLFDEPDLALKKLAEESCEVALAVKNADHDNLVWELADVMYHAAVIMVANGVEPSEVSRELGRRAQESSR